MLKLLAMEVSAKVSAKLVQRRPRREKRELRQKGRSKKKKMAQKKKKLS